MSPSDEPTCAICDRSGAQYQLTVGRAVVLAFSQHYDEDGRFVEEKATVTNYECSLGHVWSETVETKVVHEKKLLIGK